MSTLSFSETYNLFKLDDMRAIIEECLAKDGILETNSHSTTQETTLCASGGKLSIRITLRQETIGKEGGGYFQGQHRVKIEAVATSRDDKNLEGLVDKFRYCVLIRASRGGG